MSRRSRVGPMHPRVVATFALIPVVFGVEIGLYASATTGFWGLMPDVRYLEWIPMFAVSAGPVAVFYGVGLLIWWPTVAWTARKKLGVLITTLVLLAVLAPTVLLFYTNSFSGFAVSVAVDLIAGAVALTVVAYICWEPPPAGPAVPCPSCGYDLRGQRECRCPECGERFTLGELMPQDGDETP